MRYPKQKLSDIRTLHIRLREWLGAKGAAREVSHRDGADNWTLPTTCGPLSISFYSDGTALFCRFADVPAALGLLGRHEVNEFTGKWNSHPAVDTVDRVFDELTRWHLERVLSTGGVS